MTQEKEEKPFNFSPEVAEELGIHELDMLNLDPSTRESIIQARLEAREIRFVIQPHDIIGWHDLMQKLEDALVTTRSNARICDHVPGKKFLETVERIGFEADCRRRGNTIGDGAIPVRFNLVPFWKWLARKFT